MEYLYTNSIFMYLLESYEIFDIDFNNQEGGEE